MNETTGGQDRRPRRQGRVAIWLLVSILPLIAAALLVGLALVGMAVKVPGWGLERIEERFNATLSGGHIEIGEMLVTIERPDLRPVAIFRGVILSDEEERPQANLPDIRVAFDAAALLRRQIVVSDLAMEDARLRVRRAADGTISVDFGSVFGAPVAAAGSVAEVLASIADLFDLPALRSLDRATARNVSLELEDAQTGRRLAAAGGMIELRQTNATLDLGLWADLREGGGTEGPVQGSIGLSATVAKDSLSTTFTARAEDVDARFLSDLAAPFGWLRPLEAKISASVSASMGEGGGLDRLHGTLRIGAGQLKPTPGSEPVPFDEAQVYLSYDPAQSRINFDSLAFRGPLAELEAEGHAYVVFKDDALASYIGQLRFRKLRFIDARLFEAPVSFAEAAADLRLVPEPFRLDIGQLALVADSDHRVVARGTVRAEPDGWLARIEARSDLLDLAEATALWPVRLAPKTRAWVQRNVTSGTIRHATANVIANPGQPVRTAATFDFTDGTARFMRTMPPLVGAAGRAAFDGRRFSLALDAGGVEVPGLGWIDGAGTSMVVRDVREKPAHGRFDIKARGPLRAALGIIDAPPLELLKRGGRSPTDIGTGTVTGSVQLEMPLRKGLTRKDIDFAVDGRIENFRSDTLVRGHLLEAHELFVEAGPERISVSGQGTLSGIPFAGEWRRDLGPEAPKASVVTAKAELSPKVDEAFRLGLPKGLLSGAASADVRIDLPDGEAPRLAATSDLRGISMRVDALRWAKPAATPATFRLEATLGEAPRVEELVLEGAGLSARGTVEFRPGGGFDTARFDRFRVGRWADTSLVIARRDRGATLDFTLEGGTVDVRRMPSGRGGSGQRGGGMPTDGILAVRLDRFIVSDGVTLSAFSGRFTMQPALDGRFAARVNGKAEISGRVLPQRRGMAIRVNATDAGAVLRAAGIYANGHGGDLDLVFYPAEAPASYDGSLEIRNIRVRNAPALAGLLSAISVVGILEQLSGDGILFGEVLADFRLTPKGVTIRNGTAVGASLGISAEGIMDTERQLVDLQGTVTPVYLLNGVFGALTGSSRREGMFGFSYRLAGPADAPRVEVNPLSILTPGIFREIFRRKPPELSQ